MKMEISQCWRLAFSGFSTAGSQGFLLELRYDEVQDMRLFIIPADQYRGAY